MADKVFSRRPDLQAHGAMPSHARISSWLERLITTSKLQPGDRLPPEVEMAEALGVSRMTLRQALADVERKGLLQRRRGRFGGNFVAIPRVEFTLAARLGFTEQMRRANVRAGAHVVSASTIRPPDEVRVALRLSRGKNVHEILRVRFANRDPVTLERMYVPEDVYPGLPDLDLTDSLYTLMERNYGTPPDTVEETIEPVKATLQQAELLHVQEHDPLLLVIRTSWAAGGLPIERSYDYFRPDRSRITVRTSADGSGLEGTLIASWRKPSSKQSGVSANRDGSSARNGRNGPSKKTAHRDQ